MTVAFSASNQSVSAAPIDLITSALKELAVIDAWEAPGAEESAWGLEKLQRLIDQWNARREMIFSISFSLFTLIANHAPHTIGPAGDFNVPIRPVKVASASFILSGSSGNPVDSPIKVMDKDWWAANPVKSLPSSITTHLYYDPAATLGNLNFWPICNVGNPVRLELWNSITQAVDMITPIALPQAYWNALVTSLAIELGPSYNKPISPDLRFSNQKAMEAVLDNNNEPPRIETDAGMPNSRKSGRPDFNFLTGLRE